MLCQTLPECNPANGLETAFPEEINLSRNKPPKPIKRRTKACKPRPIRSKALPRASRAASPGMWSQQWHGAAGGGCLLMPPASHRGDLQQVQCRVWPQAVQGTGLPGCFSWLEQGCEGFYEVSLFQEVPTHCPALGGLFNGPLRLLKLLQLALAELKRASPVDKWLCKARSGPQTCLCFPESLFHLFTRA